MNSKRKLSILSITMVMATITIVMGTQSSKGKAGVSAPELEGTWITTVTIPDGPPPFIALHTYSRGGTLLQSNQTDEVPGEKQSPGHGVWKKTGDHQYAFTLVIFQYDEGGNVTGALKVKEAIQLNNENEYTGLSEVQICDPSVNNCVSVGCSTTHATRLIVEAPACE